MALAKGPSRLLRQRGGRLDLWLYVHIGFRLLVFARWVSPANPDDAGFVFRIDHLDRQGSSLHPLSRYSGRSLQTGQRGELSGACLVPSMPAFRFGHPSQRPIWVLGRSAQSVPKRSETLRRSEAGLTRLSDSKCLHVDHFLPPADTRRPNAVLVWGTRGPRFKSGHPTETRPQTHLLKGRSLRWPRRQTSAHSWSMISSSGLVKGSAKRLRLRRSSASPLSVRV
jgi:hypothetical protein